MNKFTEDQFLKDIKWFYHNPSKRIVYTDLDFQGHLIIGVPVYKDHEGKPSENVSGMVLTKLWNLVREYPDQRVIDFE